MKVLSLFSGVGGFDLGLETAGMETVFQCEWDKHATSILERHWPHVPRWGDISTLTGKHILQHAPVIDVVAWGSPCQDLSVAGKRAGLEGSRSGLFHEGVRIIKELRKETNNEYPRISIWENVYGALNSNRGADFGVILNEMAEAGSLVQEWRVLDAQYFGVPQRRRRVFLISVFDTATATRCPDPLLPVSEGVQWHPSTSHTTRQTTSGETPTSPRDSSCETFVKSKWPQTAIDDETWVADQPNPTLNAFDQGDTRTTTAIVFDDDRRVGPRIFENTVSTLQAFMGTGGNNTPMVAQEPMVFQPGSMIRLGTKPSDGIVPTLRAEVKGGDNEPVIAYETQDPVLMRQREGKPGGGKGPLLSNDKSLTLAGSNDQTLFTPIGFSHTQGLSAQPSEAAWPTLRTEGNGMAVAIPIHDQATRFAGKRGDKQDGKGNGLGIGSEGDPMNTLTSTDRHAVAFQYSGDRNNRSVSVSEEIAYTLAANAQSKTQSINTHMAVRRLTPLECERLMGWPDGWTATKNDGTPQSDTHRYKQCGNGVASPVAQWIAEQLLKL
jgi:DNA (cytosine-5)-methyltransferase 1